jgi:putative thioredoxin
MSAANAFVQEVTETTFQSEVIEKSKQTPVVVDFWAPWCGPCRALTPVLEKLVGQRGGEVLLAKVNTDEQQNLAMKYGIEALPTVVAFRNGKPTLSFQGALPEPQLVDFLDRVLPTEADKQAQKAVDLEKTDPKAAEALYRAALKADPDQEESVLGLSRLLLDQNSLAEAAEWLERVGPGSVNGVEAEKLAARLWLQQQASDLPGESALRDKIEAEPKNAELRLQLGTVLAGAGRSAEALEMLYQAAELDRKLASGKVRETMVKIFHVVGVRSELADDFRSKLSSLLY